MKESCNDAHTQVVIDNLPQELDLDQQTAAKISIRNCRMVNVDRLQRCDETAQFGEPVGNIRWRDGNISRGRPQLHDNIFTKSRSRRKPWKLRN